MGAVVEESCYSVKRASSLEGAKAMTRLVILLEAALGRWRKTPSIYPKYYSIDIEMWTKVYYFEV